MKLSVRDLDKSDWTEARAVYLSGLATGDASFETEAPEWDEWNAKHLPFARLAALSGNNQLIGWAALSAISSRAAYSGVAEVSVYVAEGARGSGVGRVLLEHLINASEQNGIWTLQASIFPENEASLKLHQAFGFRVVGRRERISTLAGAWRDTFLVERRSKVVGGD